MKKNQDKEKPLFSLIFGEIEKIRIRRKRNAALRSRTEKETGLVQARLSRWVAEGKHLVKYNCMDDILEDLDLTSYELTY